MRMWNVPVELMCSKHLRGEHVECHMFVGSINKGKSMKGFVQDGLVDVRLIKTRHDILAEAIVVRGGKHESPLASFLPPDPWNNFIDIGANIMELARRCPDCYDRIKLVGYDIPFPRGGDKVFEHDGRWWVQLTGQWLTGESYPKRSKALAELEKIRRNMTLRRQGRL